MALQTHEFTLILSGIAELTPQVLDTLYEAGCDDALIGMRDGAAFADFCRDGTSLHDAVLSALRDVKKAGIDAQIEQTATAQDDSR